MQIFFTARKFVFVFLTNPDNRMFPLSSRDGFMRVLNGNPLDNGLYGNGHSIWDSTLATVIPADPEAIFPKPVHQPQKPGDTP